MLPPGHGHIDLIVIAASTGGPEALTAILTKLPGDLTQPILIVQHMPKKFTNIMANILNGKCQLRVVEAQQGDEIIPGQVLIAPGGQHMLVGLTVENKLIVELGDTPFLNGVRPAADVLFQSVAEVCKGKNILALILTGMGRDGKMGVMQLKKTCNCYCLVQSEQTCIVYGMPFAVVEVGLSDEIVDLDFIAERIQNLCQK